MRAVVQRVSRSSVTVEGELKGAIDRGIMVLLGVEQGDGHKDVDYLVDKILNLRIFEDADDKMNLSVMDVGGSMLAVSQFTLLGDCRNGRRPSYSTAARPEEANLLYESFVAKAATKGIKVETGQFQAHMMVDILNDGPVTLMIDSKKTF